MKAIYEVGLQGFYIDAQGNYGIVIGQVYICCFINSDDGNYDVTVDTVDKNGDFASNICWESYYKPEDAILELCHNVKRFVELLPTLLQRG